MKNMNNMKNLMVKLTIQHKGLVLIGIFFVLAMMAPSFKLIKENFDIKIWLDKESVSYQNLEELEKRFGNDEAILIGIYNKKGIFNNETINIIGKITEQAWSAPQVIRVDSLTNYNWIESRGDDIIIDSFVDYEKEYSQNELKVKEVLATTHPVVKDYLVNSSGNMAIIFAKIKSEEGVAPEYEKITKVLNQIIRPYQSKDITIRLSGSIPLNHSFKEAADHDLFTLFPFLFLIIILYLIFVFKSIVGLVYPLAVVFCTIMTTMGIGFYLGVEVNNITSMTPLILVAIGLSDSIHLLSSYFQYISSGEDKVSAIKHAIDKNFKATVLTTISTMIGFFSLMTTNLGPIVSLGFLSGIGTLIAWFYTYLLLGATLLPFSAKPNAFFVVRQNRGENTFSHKLYRFISRFQKQIILFTIIMTCVYLYFANRLVANSNPYKYFKENSSIQIANNFFLKEFKGNQGAEIIINSGKLDGVKSPVFLKKVEEFKDFLESNPRILKSTDFINILKKINQALNGGDETFYKIPESRKKIAESILFYSMGLPQGMSLTNLIDVESQRLRMSLLWDYQDSKDSIGISKSIKEKARELGLNITLTGKELSYQLLVGRVVTSFISSLSYALLIVTILLAISFKSIKIGLFSLIPNIIPMCLGLGFLYVAGIPFDLGTCMVFAITLGISVDDTIHFISSFDKLSYTIKDKKLRIQEVIKTTGNALFVTTMVLVTSFGSLIFGCFIPNVNFGITCAVVLLCALILDFVFLPAILLLDIFSFFEKKNNKNDTPF